MYGGKSSNARVAAMREQEATMTRAVPSDPREGKGIPAGYKRTEVGVIPEDWDTRTIVAVADIHSGATPSTRNPAYWNGPIPWCTPTDITGSVTKHLSETERNITENGLDNCGATLLPVGSLLLCSRATIGEVKIAAVPLCTNQGFKSLVCRDGTDYEFVYYLLLTLKPRLLQKAAGSTFLEIGKHDLASIQIAFPPPPEQSDIAEALSDVDGLLEALDALIAKKRALKQAAMQQLLTGAVRLPGFSGEWRMRRVDSLANVDPENLTGTTDPDYMFNYISLEQVDAGHLLDVTEEVFRTAPSRARRVLRHDDVLMSTVRPNLLAHLHFRSQVTNAVCSTGFAVLRFRPDAAAPGFLFAQLFGRVVNQQIERTLAGSNYPAINSNDVRILEFPCPPTVTEQRAVAAVLSDMDAEITALEQRREKTLTVKQGMMQQLLTGRVRLGKPGTDSTPGKPQGPCRKRGLTGKIHPGVAVQSSGG